MPIGHNTVTKSHVFEKKVSSAIGDSLQTPIHAPSTFDDLPLPNSSQLGLPSFLDLDYFRG